MLFSNPVAGVIHTKSWARPSSNTDLRVTQWFGCTGFVWEPALGSCSHFHRGLDMANGSSGKDILAPHDGTVYYAGRLTDGSISVVLDHGSGWFTSYGHLMAENVSKGQIVKAGQKIGDLGSTGNSTGPHLHWGIKSGFTAAAGLTAFYGDKSGTWRDPWKQMVQNVTVHPKADDGINIRSTSSTTSGTVFAKVQNGRIVRGGVDLGSALSPRKWGGQVTGGSYTASGVTSNKWEKIWLDGAYRYIATPLCVVSAR